MTFCVSSSGFLSQCGTLPVVSLLTVVLLLMVVSVVAVLALFGVSATGLAGSGPGFCVGGFGCCCGTACAMPGSSRLESLAISLLTKSRNCPLNCVPICES